MKIKTRTNYCNTSVRMSKIKNADPHILVRMKSNHSLIHC